MHIPLLHRVSLHAAAAGFCAAIFLFVGTPSVSAQDKATLDLLVKKGIITQADEDSVAKSAAATVVTPKDAAVKGLKLEGMVQSQFDWMTTEDKGAGAANPPSNTEFLIRRAYLGAQADLGNGWNAEILFDFATGAKAAGGYQGTAGITPQPNFEKLIITKKIDDLSGLLTAGYRKVNFTLEEMTPTTVLKPIERSILSNYFDSAYKGQTGQRLGFASRHAGLFWDGTVPNSGFFYGAAFVNGVQSALSYTNPGGLDRFGGWAYLGYGGTLGDDFNYKTGVNFGYTPNGNSIATQANSVWGYNPYFSVTYDKQWQLDADFIQAMVTNGRASGPAATSTQRAAPYGFSFTPSYKINPQWELVARYTYLFTDGRGTNISDVVPDGQDVSSAGKLFNDAQSVYVGINWNIIGDSVKVLAGYEWDEFNHRATTGTITANNLTGPRAVVNGFRTRIQLLF